MVLIIFVQRMQQIGLTGIGSRRQSSLGDNKADIFAFHYWFSFTTQTYHFTDVKLMNATMKL